MNLVVMAAGIGSRFGGLKQITPVGPNGEFLIDYSIYDAIKAGVKKVIFVIKEEHLDLFRDTIGRRIEKQVEVKYAFQKMDDLPVVLEKIPERIKPWGTGHAILASRNYIDSNFMVINADDFYGRDAFITLGNYLKDIDDTNSKVKHYCMVGYHLVNTLSLNGTVSRGICEIEDDYLVRVTERTKIGYQDGKLVYFEDGNTNLIDENVVVSCNLFGFTKGILEDGIEYFKEFLSNEDNLSNKEFYLPVMVQKSIDDKRCELRVLNTTSKFNGITYKEDLDNVKKYILELINEGIYPEELWGSKK